MHRSPQVDHKAGVKGLQVTAPQREILHNRVRLKSRDITEARETGVERDIEGCATSPRESYGASPRERCSAEVYRLFPCIIPCAGDFSISFTLLDLTFAAGWKCREGEGGLHKLFNLSAYRPVILEAQSTRAESLKRRLCSASQTASLPACTSCSR